MKLLNKSTLYFVLSLFPVLVIGWFIIYILIGQQISDNTDETLVAQKKIIISNFIIKDSIEIQYFNDADNDVKISSLRAPKAISDIFSNIVVFDSTEMEYVTIRQLQSSFVKDGKPFEIVVTRSNFNSKELAESISIALLLMFGLILVSVIIINRLISKRLFAPFYYALEKLSRISFADTAPISFQSSSTTEFHELNRTLDTMTRKMFVDYTNQKQFTENAAHELQTPLAVITSRIDMLIQDRNLSENSMEQIHEIEKSVKKLSNLNKSLLLLSKIENRQFEGAEDVYVQEVMDKILFQFEEPIKSKNLRVMKEYLASTTLHINPFLAEILLSNLVQNAVRYNMPDGDISIELKGNLISISNSGEPIQGNTAKLFDRFTKFSSSVESIGLGLAIVKQICLYYNFKIHYRFMDGMHTFEINF